MADSPRDAPTWCVQLRVVSYHDFGDLCQNIIISLIYIYYVCLGVYRCAIPCEAATLWSRLWFVVLGLLWWLSTCTKVGDGLTFALFRLFEMIILFTLVPTLVPWGDPVPAPSEWEFTFELFAGYKDVPRPSFTLLEPLVPLDVALELPGDLEHLKHFGNQDWWRTYLWYSLRT